MAHDTFNSLLMGYLDGELTELERQRVEEHLDLCPQCSAELVAFRRLKEMTQPMRLAIPDDRHWEEYWSHVYNRLERRIGWILFSVGIILLASYGVYQMLAHLLLDEGISILMRASIIALVVGFCTLLVSVVRERLHLAKTDKYRRIKR